MTDVVAELEQLNQLREAGALTDEEYQQAKGRLLGQTTPGQAATDASPTSPTQGGPTQGAQTQGAPTQQHATGVPVTTTDHIAAFETVGVVGPVFADAVAALDEGAEGPLPGVLSSARREALDRLVDEAVRAGGNMIVGLRHEQVMTGRAVTVTVYGTAVTSRPRRRA